jgi:hypothetical protein
MQNWKQLYAEHTAKIADQIPEIVWQDLWHNQVNFLETEHPFQTPANFLSYRSVRIEDNGLKTQKVRVQVDFYLFYETFADTYLGASNQDTALEFIDLLDKINAVFHGTDGESYSNMRRTSFAPVDTGNAGNLYRVSFECDVIDYSAIKNYVEYEIDEIKVDLDQTPYDVD